MAASHHERALEGVGVGSRRGTRGPRRPLGIRTAVRSNGVGVAAPRAACQFSDCKLRYDAILDTGCEDIVGTSKTHRCVERSLSVALRLLP